MKRNVKKVLAVSHALEQALRDNGIPHTCTIHNGISTEEWKTNKEAVQDFRSRFHLKGRKVILFGGRISPDKGSTPLLHALARLRTDIPEVLLLVMGDKNRWLVFVAAATLQEDLSSHSRCTGCLRP